MELEDQLGICISNRFNVKDISGCNLFLLTWSPIGFTILSLNECRPLSLGITIKHNLQGQNFMKPFFYQPFNQWPHGEV